MATQYQTGSWTSSSILAGYGLTAVIGPQEPTSADVKRLNSRAGGPHSGHGNWMQTFNPRPIQKSGRPKKMYNYDYVETPIVQKRNPGLEPRKVSKFKGLKKSNVLSNLAPSRDTDGSQAAVVNNGQRPPADPFMIGNMRSVNAAAAAADRDDEEEVAQRFQPNLARRNATRANVARRFQPSVARAMRRYATRGPNGFLGYDMDIERLPPPYEQPSAATLERLEMEAAERAAY